MGQGLEIWDPVVEGIMVEMWGSGSRSRGMQDPVSR